MPTRCAWCTSDPLYQTYHDKEWGVPLRDEQKLFEFLILEGMQAGLSWLTILKKREAFRHAFAGFDPDIIARFKPRDLQKLLTNPAIIRHRGKLESVITNAQAWLNLKQTQEVVTYLWQFTAGKTRQNAWKQASEVPASTAESIQMAKSLKQQGFNFVGPTICYAFMQAVGMVNDHTVDCFRHGRPQGAPLR